MRRSIWFLYSLNLKLQHLHTPRWLQLCPVGSLPLPLVGRQRAACATASRSSRGACGGAVAIVLWTSRICCCRAPAARRCRVFTWLGQEVAQARARRLVNEVIEDDDMAV